MLWTIFVVLLVCSLLGLVTSYDGWFYHPAVLAIVTVVFRFFQAGEGWRNLETNDSHNDWVLC